MKRIRNYLLTTIIVMAPALLLAHPGHEHHGTGMEMIFHFLVTITLAVGLGAGLFYLTRYYHRSKNRINQSRQP